MKTESGRRELRQLRSDASALIKAIAETIFYRRIIFDPPPRDGWPSRFHLRKVRR